MISDENKAQELYALFATQNTDQTPPAGWSACVIVEFDFSCGHSQIVLIDNTLANWTGLGKTGDSPVPDEFLDVFRTEFQLPHSTPQ